MARLFFSYMIIFGLLLSGCGPRFYLAADKNNPAQIVVSAYTQDGCTEELHAEAKSRGVEVKLKKIDADLGWQIFLFPFYKGYKCTGEVTTSGN